jgi:2-polyprenyl-6-methoxyphenol hydroxylase-like FAD-dependent oxidoreductase
MAGKPRILIVGAGIAGLALAAGLERSGITPAVVELQDASLSRGLALMLTNNATLALRRIGLDGTVAERGTVLERIVQTGASGNLIDEHDFRLSNDRYAPNLGIMRDGLMAALSGAVRAEIRYSTTIASVDGPADIPDVVFSDGTSAQFDLIVGADGLHSAVRKLIYPQAEPDYRSFCAWRAVMDYPEGSTIFRIRSSPGCLLGSFQVGPDLVYAFLLAHYAAIPSLSRDEHLERFKELTSAFRGSIPSLIQQQRDPARVIFVPVQEVVTPSYHRGRILMIGDAAHAFPPLLAQGAAMAIEDAVALAELLGQSSDVDQVLRVYESRRRPRVETIRAAVRHLTATRGFEGPVTPELLKQHPPVFSSSLKAYDDLIEDPFARDLGSA